MDIYTEERPWGGFRRFTCNEPSTVKIITVKPGEAFSLQYHKERSEFWRVLSGEGEVTLGDERKLASPGQEFFIAAGEKHRAAALGRPLVILEIAFGRFREDDIVRIEDRYNRL